jgi:hypothetical protein
MVLFFFSSRVCSLTFFFYLNKIFSPIVHAYVCVFVLRSLSRLYNDWPNAIDVWVALLLLTSSTRFLLFIIIIIIILILSSSKRTKKNERFFRFLFFFQTNSVDTFSITNIFYHLVCHIICPNICKEMFITILKWKYKSKKEGVIHFVIRINTSKPDHSDQYQYRPSFLS